MVLWILGAIPLIILSELGVVPRAVFFFVFAGIVALAAALTWVTGSYNSNRYGHIVIYERDRQPRKFWLTVCVQLGFAAYLAGLGIFAVIYH